MRRASHRHALAISAGLLLTLAGTGPVFAANLSDEEVRQLIVTQSLRSYPGNCPCPYNVDQSGRRCGKRSAWSKPRGYSPTCFVNEVSDEQIRAFRAIAGSG
jgi:hypothetical protein